MAKQSFTRYVEQELGKFPYLLVYAVLEWTLIILILIYGFVAFVANEFAKFFELQIPCLLCTRIDHHLTVDRNYSDLYYNDSLCKSHKKNVSSLAYCHNHKKLSDIRKMYEACLLSFATEKESNCDTYKSLVGILHKDLECFFEDDHHQIQLILPSFRTKDHEGIEGDHKSSINTCSCCGQPLKVKSSYAKGTHNASLFSQAPTPSPQAPWMTTTKIINDNRGFELPNIRHLELKYNDYKNFELIEMEDGSNAINTHPQYGEELNEDSNKIPNFIRGNKFFGIPLTDSAQNSPRYCMRITRKSTPLEKTEVCSEQTEGIIVNEADSDSILNHLKKEVRMDRKTLIDVCMELDEERSASAVAANNAMAMITRLQAEKAAVQMEALQYQRMMEEQAEYDQEAVQSTNDLLIKREEDVKVLEVELQVYRDIYGSLSEEQLIACQNIGAEADEECQKLQSLHYSSYNGTPECGSSPFGLRNEEKISQSFKFFNGGKSTYLLGRLNNLDNKNQLSENGDHLLQLSTNSTDIDLIAHES